MEYHSPYQIDITISDIPSFIFASRSSVSKKSPLYFDAENPTKCYSLEEAEIMVKRIAKGLQNLGLQQGERVLLVSGNQLHFPVLFWGVIAAECVFTGCTPAASVQELEYQLKDSGASLILAGPEAAQKALDAARKVGLPESKVFCFCDVDILEAQRPQPCGLKPWTTFWAPTSQIQSWNWKKIGTKKEAEETTAVINYSSGTTGFPKGVEISHYNLIANAEQASHKRNMVADTAKGRARKERLDVSGGRWLAAIPMYHAYGQTYFCMNGPLSGAKVFIMRQFTLDRYMHFIDIYRITYMNAVPTIMVMLSKDPSAVNYNFHSIEEAVCGSAPLGKEIGQAVQKRLFKPGVSVKQGWGMTEATCTGTAFAPDDEDDGGSVGWLMANLSAMIIPVDGEEFEKLSRDGKKIGELWISGPNVMKGYFNRPNETAETIFVDPRTKKRWLRTGDIGYFDSRGCLYIVDRLKELIKVKGLQVAPAEIEAVLLSHPDVQDAAVAAVKKGDFEYPKGYIVRRSKSLTAKELEKWVQERLSRHKWLTGGISFIELVPRTASGKVKRRELPNAKLEAKESKL